MIYIIQTIFLTKNILSNALKVFVHIEGRYKVQGLVDIHFLIH